MLIHTLRYVEEYTRFVKLWKVLYALYNKRGKTGAYILQYIFPVFQRKNKIPANY